MHKSPEGWKPVKLGDVVKHIKDRNPDRSKWTFNRYISGEHIDNGEIRITKSAPIEGNEEVIGPAFHMRFKPGQVLYVTRRAYLRKCGMAFEEGVCSNVAFTLETKSDKMLQTLLPFLMQTEAFVEHATNNSHGSTNPFLNWKDIASFEFSLPPMEEQKKINELLWDIENHIKDARLTWEKLSRYARKVQKELMLQNGIKEKIKLSSVLKLEYGSGLTEKDRIPGEIPVIGSNGIVGTHNKSIVEGPCIIIGRKGTAGTVIFIEDNCFPIDTTYYVKIIDSKKILLKYVYYLLNSSKITRFVETTGVPGLNRGYVHKMEVGLPDINKQKQVIKKIECFDDAVHNFETYVRDITNLRNKLMNELLSGKLRLMEAIKNVQRS